MRKTKSEIYLHFVWKTWDQLALVVAEIENAVHRCIVAEAESLGCSILAIGGTEDHIHLAVRISAKISASKLAQQVKGVSSTFVRNQLRAGELFRWQSGYGVFSFHRRDSATVIKYITKQKQRHHKGKTWQEWEESTEEVEEAQAGE